MQRLLTLFAVLMLAIFSISDAEAKKFGGGKSFGKSYQTAPSQPAANAASNAANPAAAATGAAAAGAKKGMLGGILGGLLMGGLIASLFGGAFEGLQLMDILIMAGLGFVLFKLFKRKTAQAQPRMAYAGAAGPVTPESQPDFQTRQSAQPQGGGFGASQVPFNLPAGFDANRFLQGAREHYRALQDAWNKNDLSKIQEYVSPELYDALSAERAGLSTEQHTEVLFVDAELVRAEQLSGRAELSVKFSGQFRDTVEGVEEAITDIWHLERDLTTPNAPWLIVGIEA